MKTGRNDPCPCGSGKKYKKCCLNKMPNSDTIEAIQHKIKFIEEKTKQKVIIDVKESSKVDASIDFPHWSESGQIGLPRIIRNLNVPSDSVHILHELIHLEYFFVKQYPLICTNNENFHSIINIFKNIPEDYVVHKIIWDQHNKNPIEEKWFQLKDNINDSRSEKELARDLIQYDLFSDYYQNYKSKLNNFKKKCEMQKSDAFRIYELVMTAIMELNLNDKESYTRCLEEIVKAFEPEYYQKESIYPAYLSPQGKDRWEWSR